MKHIKAWQRQEKLKQIYKDEEVPDIEELVDIINTISIGKTNTKFQTMRARALFSMYYLSGCRLSEIIRCNKLRKQKIKKKIVLKNGIKRILYKTDLDNKIVIDRWIEEHSFEGIKKKDISFKLMNSRKCMIIRAENRKNKLRKTKRLPIPIELERPIAAFIYAYIKVLNDHQLLFDFGIKRATQIINDTTGFNIHFIRHIRATHLITKYDFNEQALIKFMGWTDSRPAKYYVDLKTKDTFMQFFKGGK